MFKNFPFYFQYDTKDCGPACLKIISKYYGKEFELNYLIDLCFYTRKGVSLKGISHAAENLGFKTIGVCTSFEKLLKEQPVPFIIYWKQDHFLVIYKMSRSKVWVSDPAIGKYKISKQEFISGWADTIENGISKGICLLLQPLPIFYQKEEGKNNRGKQNIKFLFKYILPYKKLMLQLIYGLIIGSIIQLSFPFLMQSIVDIGIKRQNLPFVYIILLAQLVLILSSSFVEIIRSWILLHINIRVNIALVSDFLIKIMKLPISFFETKMTGDIKQRIDDHHRIEQFLTVSTISIIFSFLNIIIFSFVLGFYNIKILGIFYFNVIIYIFWVLKFLRKRKKLDTLRFGQLSENQNVLYRLLTQMQEIKLHNAESKKRWEWENVQARVFRLNMKQLSLSQTQSSGGTLIYAISNMIISVFSATLVIKGEISLGMMLAIQYIIGQMNAPVERIIQFINSLQDAKLSLKRLSEVHLRKEENESSNGKNFITIDSKKIQLQNLSFQYEGPYSPLALENINITIPENKVTAIVGASGSGKTTLIKILLGFYKPTSGDVFIGENNLYNYNTSIWRENIGAVLQDGIIFSDTIAENIAISSDKVDINNLEKSAKMADIHDFIMSLPLKYNTKIGDDGSGLSQGQKQRILIARAIYKNPKFVFFDEATNSLDATSEKTIVENMESFFQNRTVVIVAHRLSTVKNADQIIVLDKGKVVEIGHHHSLINKKEYYFKLIKNQLELGN